MHIELILTKLVLKIPLKIIVLRVSNPLHLVFALNKHMIKIFPTLKELNKC